jgi:hypothetical protein
VSYRAGFKAFVQRFHHRFPEPEYRYVLFNQQAIDRPPTVIVSNELWCLLIGSDGNLQTVKIYHRQTDELIAKIIADLTFGIRLQVESRYLPRPFLLFKRPKDLQKGKHQRRLWLSGKPKFAKLGAALSSQIHFNFALACSSCGIEERAYGTLCLLCYIKDDYYTDQKAITDMISEGGRI